LITTRSLTKRYGSVTAVRSVDIDVREGDRYGLLGPNGSGKTTLVRMLLGLVFATSGEIEVMGCRMPRHASRVLRDVGALVEGPAAYPNLSGRTNLKLLDAAGPRGDRRTRRRRIDNALEQVGLAGIDRRPVKAYSLGMRQRLGLAAALVRRPRLLILDEPGNGLDPHGIRDTRQLLLDLSQDGVTIFLSSHLLAEVAPGSGSSIAGGLSCRRASIPCAPLPAGSWSTARMQARWRRCSTGRSSTGTAPAWWSVIRTPRH